MANGSSQTIRAVIARWTISGLDAQFRARRTNQNSDLLVLHDTKARPATPMPYCVFEQSGGGVQSRMSGDDSSRGREIRPVRIQFRVHAATKSVAEELANSIMAAFDYAPLTPAESSGVGCVQCSYQNDFCVREDDNAWQWVVDYTILADVPTVLSPA